MKLRITSPVLFAICSLILGGYIDLVMLLHGGLYDFVGGTLLAQLYTMLVYILFLTIYVKKEASGESNMFAFCTLLMAFALQAASAVSYPRQADKSNSLLETVSDRHINFMIQTILFSIVFFGVYFLLRADKWIGKQSRWILIVTSVINCLVFVILGLIFKDSKVAGIGGIVLGLPLLGLMLFEFAVLHTFYRQFTDDGTRAIKALKKKDWIVAIAAIISLGVLICYFVKKSEYGVLFYFFFSVIAWMFFEPHPTLSTLKQRLIWYGSAVAAVILALIIAVVTYSIYKTDYDIVAEAGEIPQDEIDVYVSKMSFRHLLGSKVARVFLNTGLKFIRSAGIFGNSGYVYDIAANNDYALGLQIHNFGLLWLMILVVLMLLFCITGCIFLSNQKREGTSTVLTLRTLSFFCILALVLYPISSNIGLTGIIGVSAFCAGYSGMHAVLCAFLMASVLYERHDRR